MATTGIINSAAQVANPSVLAPELGAPVSTPVPATGIIGGAQAAAPVDYTSRINDIYQTQFGRKADDAGMDFWTKAAQQNPTGDLTAMIKGGAQTQDSAAMADIANGGINTSNTWGSDLNANDVASQKDTWDAVNNRWVTAAPPSSPGAAQLGTPTQWNITPDQTVQGQMKNLIDPNSPYYQQWATAGAQDAAARGFTGNSSIRETGIMDSVMRGATPIATADASTYAKAAGYNADMPNQFAMKNADMQTQMAQANLSANTQKFVAGLSAQTQRDVANMNNQSQATISQAHDANSALIASNSNAKEAYNNYVAAVAQIDQNDKMDATAKQSAIITQTQIFNNAIAGLKAANSGTADLTSPLDVTAPTVNPAAAAVGGVDVSDQLQFGG
jgi:hypothetical protein